MKKNQNLNDDAILKELGQRLTQRRIELTLSQQDLAEQAGIGKRALERLEAGSSIQISNFVRILRKLELLDALGALIPETGPRPMDLGKRTMIIVRTNSRATPAPARPGRKLFATSFRIILYP